MGQTRSEAQRSEATSTGVKALTSISILLMVVLRCFALDSDAYSRLSWSSALLTDEGFYIHNARNAVLFGHTVTDSFNNMLIMPALHLVQCGVFAICGAGAVQARSISVAAGLAALVVFFFAMRRCFGTRIASIAVLFLGLGHANLLYNRLALMDTPGALCIVCVFAAWVYAVSAAGKNTRDADMRFMLCGALIMVAYSTRGLSAWIAPIPFVLLLDRAWRAKDHRKIWLRSTVFFAAGFAIGLTIYICGWYVPHHAEISRMTRYYLVKQMLPPNWSALRGNITHALVGDARGLSPYLFRHTPIEFSLALAMLAAGISSVLPADGYTASAGSERSAQSMLSTNCDDESPRVLSEMGGRFLLCWLLIAWITFAIISYSPPRYYVLFYPALAGLSALAVCRYGQIVESLRKRWIVVLLAAFLSYHAGEALIHHNHDAVLAVWVALFAALFHPKWNYGFSLSGWRPELCVAALIATWAVVNFCWTADWLFHITYVQRDASRWLAKSLPANSVLIGDVAPGLCLFNRFEAVNVIPGLCNDEAPLERYASRPRYLVILDSRFPEHYWHNRYPQEVESWRCIREFPSIVKFPVGVYRVGDSPAPLPVNIKVSNAKTR